MARPIIDFEVERRKISHAQLYNDISSIPMYQQDVEQSMDIIKLSKASKKKEPMSFLDCLLLTSSISPDDRDADTEFITEVKKYNLSASALAEIKSMLVCTISVSPSISRGITDAMNDFASGSPRREKPSGKEDANKLYLVKPEVDLLYYTLYNEVYDRLVELCGELNVFDAASIMGGD